MAALLISTLILLLYQWILDRPYKYRHLREAFRFNEAASLNSSIEARSRTKKLPEAIIIGSRKSGTRALLKFLEINPQVRSAHNEVHFFDKPQNYKLGLEWYREQMPESEEHSLTIEKSPAYFVTKGVPERIKLMNPGIKLILVLRDPVKRLISDYSQLVANRVKVGRNNFHNASNQNLVDKLIDMNEDDLWNNSKQEFKEHVLRPDGGIDDRRASIRTGMYSVHLERWLFHFNMSQIHIVDGETLIKDPHEELHKVELFLSLEPRIKPEHFVYNQQKGFYCISSAAIPQRWNITNSTILCLSKSKGRRHVQVDENLVMKLSKFYKPYNDYLYSMIGREFVWNL